VAKPSRVKGLENRGPARTGISKDEPPKKKQSGAVKETHRINAWLAEDFVNPPPEMRQG
jgi:hypothetical protein